MVENSRASVQHQAKDRESKQMNESMDVLRSEKEQLETALYEAHQLLGTTVHTQSRKCAMHSTESPSILISVSISFLFLYSAQVESQKDQSELEKEQLSIRLNQVNAELDSLRQEHLLNAQRIEKQKEALQTRLAQLERGSCLFGPLLVEVCECVTFDDLINRFEHVRKSISCLFAHLRGCRFGNRPQAGEGGA